MTGGAPTGTQATGGKGSPEAARRLIEAQQSSLYGTEVARHWCASAFTETAHMVCAASTYGGAVAETESLALPVGAMFCVFQFIDCKSIGFGKDGTGSELGGSVRLTLGDDAQGVDRAVADGETVARRTDEAAGSAQGSMGMESEFHKCGCDVGVIPYIAMPSADGHHDKCKVKVCRHSGNEKLRL